MNYSKRPALKAIDLGIRKVASTYGRAVYIVHSTKCNGSITVESDGEQLAAQILAIDPSVRSFKPQPFVVDLIGGRILRSDQALKEARNQYRLHDGPKFYTPDYEASMVTHGMHAIEVKVEGFTGEADYELKLARASDILAAHGYTFKRMVLPRSRLHPIRVNAPLLFQASTRRDALPAIEECTAIVEWIGDKTVKLLDLVANGLLQPSLAPVMVTAGILGTDVVGAPINGQSLLHSACGDLTHLEIVLGACQ
jgi:hypothetical protein